MNINRNYKNILEEVLANGAIYNNERRNVERLQIPSYTFRHDFEDGFPALGLKKLPFKTVVAELCWFLRGENTLEFLHKHNCHIWDADAKNWENKTGEKNSVGQNYSKQWRDYGGKVDQIDILIDGMIKDIMSSRLKVEAWNPLELDDTALPPCHTGFQIIGVPLSTGEFGFELHWNQRSVDLFLGLPFNIASYGILAKILENITGYKALAIQGDLKCVHLYDNSVIAAQSLIFKEDSFAAVELEIASDLWGEDLDPINFRLIGYESHEAVKVEMIAPKSI
jgi:thymidylate synthase